MKHPAIPKRLLLILCNVAIFCLIIVVFVGVYGSNLPRERYYSDEGDYQYAVSKGFIANYLDKNSLSLFSFIRYGLSYGFSKKQLTPLSNIARSEGGDDFYRHYHVPLFFYYLALGKRCISNNEVSFRWLSASVLILCSIVVFMALRLLNGQPGAIIGQYFAACMIVFSSALFDTVAFISPHMTYAFFTGVVLLLTAAMIKKNDLALWYGTIVCLALATLSVEYSPVLFVAFIISIYVNKKYLFPEWTGKDLRILIGKSAAVYFLSIFIVWPSGILKLSIIKSYVYFAYWAIVRGGNYGTESFIKVWLQRFALSPVEYGIIFLSLGISIFMLKKRRWLSPFVAYCSALFLLTMRNTSPASSHISSFVAAGIILSGVLVNDVLKMEITVKTVITLLFVVLNCLSFVYFFLPQYRMKYGLLYRQLNGMVEYVETHYNEKMLVQRECLMTLHYYYPQKKMDSFRWASEIEAFVQKNRYASIIYWGAEQRSVIDKLRMKYSVYQKDDIVYFRLLNTE
jgi:hypothetical protein